jgi:hypothetical protein
MYRNPTTRRTPFGSQFAFHCWKRAHREAVRRATWNKGCPMVQGGRTPEIGHCQIPVCVVTGLDARAHHGMTWIRTHLTANQMGGSWRRSNVVTR